MNVYPTKLVLSTVILEVVLIFAAYLIRIEILL